MFMFTLGQYLTLLPDKSTFFNRDIFSMLSGTFSISLSANNNVRMVLNWNFSGESVYHIFKWNLHYEDQAVLVWYYSKGRDVLYEGSHTQLVLMIFDFELPQAFVTTTNNRSEFQFLKYTVALSVYSVPFHAGDGQFYCWKYWNL